MTHRVYELSEQQLQLLSLSQVLGLIGDWELDRIPTEPVFKAVDSYLERNWTQEGYLGWRNKYGGNHVGGIKAVKSRLRQMGR